MLNWKGPWQQLSSIPLLTNKKTVSNMSTVVNLELWKCYFLGCFFYFSNKNTKIRKQKNDLPKVLQQCRGGTCLAPKSVDFHFPACRGQGEVRGSLWDSNWASFMEIFYNKNVIMPPIRLHCLKLNLKWSAVYNFQDNFINIFFWLQHRLILQGRLKIKCQL